MYGSHRRMRLCFLAWITFCVIRRSVNSPSSLRNWFESWRGYVSWGWSLRPTYSWRYCGGLWRVWGRWIDWNWKNIDCWNIRMRSRFHWRIFLGLDRIGLGVSLLTQCLMTTIESWVTVRLRGYWENGQHGVHTYLCQTINQALQYLNPFYFKFRERIEGVY